MIRTVVEPMRWDNYARQHNLVIYISYQLRHQHLSTRSRFVNHQSSFRTEASRTSKPSPCIDTKGACASHHRSLVCSRRTHAPPHKYKVRYQTQQIAHVHQAVAAAGWASGVCVCGFSDVTPSSANLKPSLEATLPCSKLRMPSRSQRLIMALSSSHGEPDQIESNFFSSSS